MVATCFRLFRPVAWSCFPRTCAVARLPPSQVLAICRLIAPLPPTPAPRNHSSTRSFSGLSSLHKEIRRYTTDHEYLHLPTRDSEVATIGITAYAASSLGDIVYIELPSVSSNLCAGEPMGSVESVKSASEIIAPVSGVVAEVNSALADRPALLTAETAEDVSDGGSWLCRVTVGKADVGAVERELMNAEEYENYKKGEAKAE